MIGRLALSGAAAAMLAAAGQAAATGVSGLPLSSGVEGCTDGGGGSVSDSTGSCTQGGAKASFSPAPFPGVQAFGSGPGPFSQGAFADLTYYFQIDGPNNGPIEIDISADLITDGSFASFSFARILSSGGATACADTNEGLCPSNGFHGTIQELDTPGVIYSIQLEATATMNGAFPGFSSASADPFIFVDPNDLNANLYSIEISPDAVNAEGPGGVPEPASWALMILGFGLAGAGLRGRAATRPSGESACGAGCEA